MQAIMALFWSGLSIVMGILGASPSVPALSNRKLALAQLIATEDPGMGMVAGALGVWYGVRARRWRLALLGLAGIALGAYRWQGREEKNRQLSAAMRDSLGIGWQRAIPPQTHLTFGQTFRADAWGSLRHLPLTGISETRDVLFAAPDGYPLRMTIYERSASNGGARPAVIMLAGEDGVFGLRQRWLAAQGYVVFDACVRRRAGWPAPVADAKCAIRWVKRNAARYGVDPARVALMGRATAGHLALMAAYSAIPAGCFANDDIDESVAAVIANSAPTDLRQMEGDVQLVAFRLLGKYSFEQLAEASPVTHVRPGLPPTLLIHSPSDATIPAAQAEMLAEGLREARVPVTLLWQRGARHGTEGFVTGIHASMIQYDVDRFLAWVFSRETSPP